MKKTAKPKTRDNTSKRRKILLGILIPLVAGITTAAIVLGVKSCKDKKKSQTNVIVKNAIYDPNNSYVALNEESFIGFKPKSCSRILGINHVLVGGIELYSPGQYTFDPNTNEITIKASFMKSTNVEIDVNANFVTGFDKVEYNGKTQVGKATKAEDWEVVGQFTNGTISALTIGTEYRIFYGTTDITDQINSGSGYQFTEVKDYIFTIKSGDEWKVTKNITVKITEAFKTATVNFNIPSFENHFLYINHEEKEKHISENDKKTITYPIVPKSDAKGHIVVKNDKGENVLEQEEISFTSGIPQSIDITFDDWSKIADDSILTVYWVHVDKKATIQETGGSTAAWADNVKVLTTNISEASVPNEIQVSINNNTSAQQTGILEIKNDGAVIATTEITLKPGPSVTTTCTISIESWKLIGYDDKLIVEVAPK